MSLLRLQRKSMMNALSAEGEGPLGMMSRKVINRLSGYENHIFAENPEMMVNTIEKYSAV